MEINVLGTAYTVDCRTESEDTRLIGKLGYCDPTTKLLVIKKEPVTDYDSVGDVSVIDDFVLRHEIVHAFLYESGLDCYYNDETLVDWIAMQISKLIRAMREAEALPT